jgi:hypothetical protein
MADKKNGTTQGAAAGGLSKMDAVRRAMRELGNDAMPKRIQAFVKERFGVEMTNDHVSDCKKKILKKGKGKAKRAASKAPAQASAARTKAPPKPPVRPAPAPPARAIALADVEATKALVERVGADSLKRLIDVLAR